MDPDEKNDMSDIYFSNNTAVGTSGTSVGTGIYVSDNGSYSISGITGGYTIGGHTIPPTTYRTTTTYTNTWTDPMREELNEIQKFITELKLERDLRKKYPALDYAYEQYEVMLEICKLKEADDAAGENSKGP